MALLKKKWIWGVVLGLIVVSLVLVNLSNMKRAAAVKVAEVTEGPIAENIYTNGKLEPEETTEVYSPASGVVGELRVKLGDAVTKGQVLFTLKMDEIKDQLEKERISLQMTEAERLKAKKEHFDNYKQLMSESPDQTMEELDLTSYDLTIQSSKLTIASLEKKLANSTVYAVTDGTITGLDIDAGQLIAEGSRIASISDLSAYKVTANLNELDAGKAALGLKAVVTGESIAGTYDGEVTYLAPVAEITDTTSKDASVEMTVTLKTVDPELRAGYNVSIEMQIPDKQRLLVPVGAVQYEGDQTFVFKIEGDKAVKVPVTTGKEGDDVIELVSGVAKGEQIVTEGAESLKDGDKVSIHD
ncbi:efflux RND transporter periplasmic adaptor subunit [Paenibacillus sp. M1]|uniref:Efflux RND transporter periplasmic adaptor subunit n=1 Tax=Paenibacillus haidiansis TaxID=1574488 RepID=A0ABU7VR20_9BACL